MPTKNWNERNLPEVPYGYCHCGCGEKTKISPYSAESLGCVKGEPRKFVYGHSMRILKGSRYKNGRIERNGYILIRMPEHPGADQKGYVKEHRLICEQALGKPLPYGSVPHHIDGDGTNNSHDNLVLCQDTAYHKLIHRRTSALKECGNADWLKCRYCGRYDSPDNIKESSGWFHHNGCVNEYNRKRKKHNSPKIQRTLIEFDGKSMTMSAWARELGMWNSVLRNRLLRGWTIERALTEPVHISNRE